MFETEVIWQFQLQSCFQSHPPCIGIRFTNFLITTYQIDALIISDDQAFKAESPAKQIREYPTVDMAGHTLDFIECGHDRCWPRILDYMSKREHLGVEQCPRPTNIWGPVSSSTRSCVACKVLEGRRHMVGCDGAIRRTLQTTNHGRTKPRYEVRIFTERFVNASPPQIPRYIEDWRENMRYTAGSRLTASLRVDFSHKIRVPTAGKSNGCGK